VQTIASLLDKQGIVVLPAVCTPEQTAPLLDSIKSAIANCCRDLSCTRAQYLASVNQWRDPSPVTDGLKTFISQMIQPTLESHLGQAIKLAETTVFVKNRFARKALFCHQDIAFTANPLLYPPFQFALWLALNPVPLDAGAMEFLPGSHLLPIQPAFHNSHRSKQKQWRENALTCPINTGDGILFDSRTWHCSRYNRSGRERFALATRWSCADYKPPSIPPFKPHILNTTAATAVNPLTRGLKHIFHQEIDHGEITGAAKIAELATLWCQMLEQHEASFLPHPKRAHQALKALEILSRAFSQHNGRDVQASTISNVQRWLLKDLENYLTQISP